MLGRIGSSVLVFAAVLLVLQEEFLIEKIPFTFFYGCKIALKTLMTRASFGEGRTFSDLAYLLIICFGKKLIFDIFYYQIHVQKYLKYIVILICVDYLLFLLSKKYKAKNIINLQPVKTFLTLASGISDSISLENLLWRNQLTSWHLPVVFFSVALDPLILTVATWLIKGMGSKKERCKSACKKGLIFGTLLTLAHFICSRDSYSTLINLRRKIPFNTSNVMTFSVGIRLLNCLSFILLLAFELIKENMNNVSPILVKDNFVKNKPVKRDSECSISTQASSDEDSYSISSLMVEKTKSD